MHYILLIGTIFTSDQYIKRRMDADLTRKGQWQKAGGKIIFKKYCNKGAAGNFLKDKPRFLLLLHSLSLSAVFASLLYALPKKRLQTTKLGLSFFAGGGLSNLYERLANGYVTDYISFGFGPKWFQKTVFNAADFFVFAGALLCVAQSFEKKE